MEQEATPRMQLEVSFDNLIKTAAREAFTGHPNVIIAIEKLKIQPSNTADFQINCRGIANYLGMQDQVMEVANKIKEKITQSSHQTN